jgi:hypothetical protein
MRRALIFLCFAGVLSPAWGQPAHDGGAPPRDPDLKKVDAFQQVRSIDYCNGIYRVTTAAGAAHEIRERDLRLKTDSGDLGPTPGTPALLPRSISGTATIVFAAPEEIGASIKRGC